MALVPMAAFSACSARFPSSLPARCRTAVAAPGTAAAAAGTTVRVEEAGEEPQLRMRFGLGDGQGRRGGGRGRIGGGRVRLGEGGGRLDGDRGGGGGGLDRLGAEEEGGGAEVV